MGVAPCAGERKTQRKRARSSLACHGGCCPRNQISEHTAPGLAEIARKPCVAPYLRLSSVVKHASASLDEL
eukprot:5429077-Pleurochrysis_carterae.AAC.6